MVEKSRREVVEASDGSISVSIPFCMKRRSGRTTITHPQGAHTRAHGHKKVTWQGEPTPMQYALLRGHEWAEEVRSGSVSSLKEIAQRVGVDPRYVSRTINLSMLAPDIVAAILDNDVPDHLTLFELESEQPRCWNDQREKFGFNST